MKNMYNTVEKRRNLYNSYLRLKDENLELNKIAKELKISEEILNHIISEFETGVAFPKHYTERLVLDLAAEGGGLSLYQNGYGVFRRGDEEFSSFSEIFRKHDLYLQWVAPTFCAEEFLPELRREIEWHIREKGLVGSAFEESYSSYWEKVTGMEFTPEFLKSIDSQKNGLHDTEEKRKELYNAYLRLKSENLELNEIAIELRTSEEILNYIIIEFEDGMIFPEYYTERLVFKLGTEEDRILIYEDRYGVFKYKDKGFFSFSGIFYDNNLDLQQGKPTLYEKELKEELREVIEWDLRERGVKKTFSRYSEDWEKAIGAMFTVDRKFFRTMSQIQMTFFIKPNLIENGYYTRTKQFYFTDIFCSDPIENTQTKQLLSDFIEELEEEFYEKHQPLFANYLYASDSVMDKLESCCKLSENERLGMDLIDGKIDIDKNFQRDEEYDEKTVCVLPSNVNGCEKKLYFVRDNSLRDDVIVLKYI